MNWRLVLVLVVAILIALFATFIVSYLIHGGSQHPNYSKEAVLDASIAIGLPLAMVGSNRLKRAGYTKYPMRHMLSSSIFTMALLVVPFPKPVRHVVLEYGFCLFYVLIAVMLPLSFYLTHKQKRSSTETTVADAS